MVENKEPEWLSLEKGEEILWNGSPRMKSILPILVVGIPMSFVLIGIPIIALAYLNIKNTDFVVTNNGLYVKKGILSRSVQNIDFDKVQNISFSQGIFGNKFDYGNIEISTAGGSGVQMRFRSIEEPKHIQELINKHIKKDKESPGDQESDVDLAILEELKETRKAVERIEDHLSNL